MWFHFKRFFSVLASSQQLEILCLRAHIEERLILLKLSSRLFHVWTTNILASNDSQIKLIKIKAGSLVASYFWRVWEVFFYFKKQKSSWSFKKKMSATWDQNLRSSSKGLWITNPLLRLLLMAGAPSNWLNYLRKYFSAIISIESLIVYAFWSLMLSGKKLDFNILEKDEQSSDCHPGFLVVTLYV